MTAAPVRAQARFLRVHNCMHMALCIPVALWQRVPVTCPLVDRDRGEEYTKPIGILATRGHRSPAAS